MKQVVLCLVILCLHLIIHAQYSVHKKPINWEKLIAECANKELKLSGVPSLQIAIGYKDRILFEHAYGFADLENKVPATPKTEYRAASISKWWTATVAMMLASQGKLNLDIPIQTYCNDFPAKKWAVTTRQLLTHTAGIRSYLNLEEELSNSKSGADSSLARNRYNLELLGQYTHYTNLKESLGNFKEDSLLFKPGSNWSYSSQGYRVLGCVLEDVSQISYSSLMKQMIFDPASMQNTMIDDSWAIIPNRAAGYQIENAKQLRRAEMRDVSENLPAGGFLSTATDLVRFAQAFLHQKFVSADVIRLMSFPYFSQKKPAFQEPSWRDAIPSMEKYGYGLMLYPDTNSIKIGHDGRQAGFSSIIIAIPEKDLTIAVLTNAKGWNGYISFTKSIEEIITAYYLNKKK
jgi:serine beta-lactamase-like protein LACTB